MQELDSLLAPEFREFASSGEIFNKAEVIALSLSEMPEERSLADVNVVLLAGDVVLVTYRATKIGGSQKPPSNSLRSSIAAVYRRSVAIWFFIRAQDCPEATKGDSSHRYLELFYSWPVPHAPNHPLNSLNYNLGLLQGNIMCTFSHQISRVVESFAKFF